LLAVAVVCGGVCRGQYYPGIAGAYAAEIDKILARADRGPRIFVVSVDMALEAALAIAIVSAHDHQRRALHCLRSTGADGWSRPFERRSSAQRLALLGPAYTPCWPTAVDPELEDWVAAWLLSGRPVVSRFGDCLQRGRELWGDHGGMLVGLSPVPGGYSEDRWAFRQGARAAIDDPVRSGCLRALAVTAAGDSAEQYEKLMTAIRDSVAINKHLVCQRTGFGWQGFRGVRFRVVDSVERWRTTRAAIETLRECVVRHNHSYQDRSDPSVVDSGWSGDSLAWRAKAHLYLQELCDAVAFCAGHRTGDLAHNEASRLRSLFCPALVLADCVAAGARADWRPVVVERALPDGGATLVSVRLWPEPAGR
jgi:hypothetical protein